MGSTPAPRGPSAEDIRRREEQAREADRQRSEQAKIKARQERINLLQSNQGRRTVLTNPASSSDAMFQFRS